MATTEIINLTDDLDSRISNGVETVTFFDPETGDKLEIELGEANRKHLDSHIAKLEKYIAVARVVTEPKPAKKTAGKVDSEVSKIREWANKNGYTVGDRGRIKADIVEAYNVAQNAIANPDTDAQAAGDEPVSVSNLESALENSAAGNVVDMGDFTQYADDEESGKLLDEVTGNVDNEPVVEVESPQTGSVEATQGTDDAWEGDGPSDAELLNIMREVEAEKGEVTLQDLAAKVAENN